MLHNDRVVNTTYDQEVANELILKYSASRGNTISQMNFGERRR